MSWEEWKREKKVVSGKKEDVKDSQGRMLLGGGAVMKRWAKYF